MAVYHYSPADVSITFAGKSISGFPDSGAFIEISRETPLFNHKRSMDGQVYEIVFVGVHWLPWEEIMMM